MSTSSKAASRGQETAQIAAARKARRQAREARAAANGSNSRLRGSEKTTEEFMDGVRRYIIAAGERAGREDAEVMMPQLAGLREQVERAMVIAIAGYRSCSPAYSWDEIGRTLGLTRQAIQNRYQRAVEEYLAAMADDSTEEVA